MRRTNTGEARAVPLALVSAKAPSAQPVASSNMPSHITILPVSVARDVRVAEKTAFGDLRLAGGIVTASECVHVADVNRSLLHSTRADVLLLDARHARPSSVYRAIARVRSEGWARGVVLILDPKDLSVVPIGSAVGATNFVLSTASRAEVEMRLRREASGDNERKPWAANADPVAGIQLHWRTHEVSFEGTKIALTLRELQLLVALMERGRELITSPDLARLAWGKSKGSGGLTATYVCSLRKKLAWFGGRFGIRTVRGVGYRFVV